MSVGSLIRVLDFLDARPLWIDESMLALNIASRDFPELAGPLALDQTAPLFYLWVTRGSVEVFGVTELALRLPALVAGLALPWLLWLTVRRVLGPHEGAFAAVAASLSLMLIYYSNELKPYGFDALASLVLLRGALRLEERAEDVRSWAGFGVVGVLALLSSQPSIFVLAGVLTMLVASPAIRGDAAWKRRVGLLGCAWGATFLVLYWLSYRSVEGNPGMIRFWEGTYLDPAAPDFLFRLSRAGSALLHRPLPVLPVDVPTGILAFLFVAGGLGVARQSRSSALVIAGTVTSAAIASATRRFAVADRLLLFLAPLTFLVLSGALSFARGFVTSTRARELLAGACVAVLVLASAPALWRYLSLPGPRWNTKRLIEMIPPDQPVYVLGNALTRWVFYTTEWHAPDTARVSYFFRVASFGGPAHPNAPPRGKPVRCEGDDLIWHTGRRSELLGIPLGTGFRLPEGHVKPTADTGWALNEARRMSTVAAPVIWVLSSQHLESWLEELLRGVRARGGRVLDARRQDRSLRASPVGSGLFERSALFLVSFPPLSKPSGCY